MILKFRTCLKSNKGHISGIRASLLIAYSCGELVFSFLELNLEMSPFTGPADCLIRSRTKCSDCRVLFTSPLFQPGRKFKICWIIFKEGEKIGSISVSTVALSKGMHI